MRAKLRAAATAALVSILFLAAMPSARAQGPVTFNLPQQPLADALRAVASATHINIVFDPAVVAGIEAPALKGGANAREALARLLARTGLRCINVGSHTVRIARIRPPDPRRDPKPAGAVRKSARVPSQTEARVSPRHAARARAEAQTELSEVIVTGTRIAGATPVSPVITFSHEAIAESGYASVGQFLLSVPENFGGGQNPGVIGARGNNQFSISGASSANLFGLGADSTLTLVDGHRLAYDGYQNGVDLSLIPLAAVSRIEIMTGGASAIYGSDAVAGVVNVILKQHFNGVTADARYGDVTSGNASKAQYSLLAGRDWGSGNVLIAYEYAHDNPLPASERSFSAGAEQPTWLLPELNRDSAFFTSHQDLTNWMTASLDALYTSRSYNSVFTAGPTTDESVDYANVKVHEYAFSPDLTFALPGGWRLSLEGTFSHDRDRELAPQYSAVSHHLLYQDVLFYQNDLRLGALEATGPIFQLPSGRVMLAVGAGYRYEDLDTPAPNNPVQTTTSSRNVRYAYVETDIPLVAPKASRFLLEQLNLSAAFRYEHYSDFGGQRSPRLGFVYRPVEFLDLRATWSESFRAPELLDVYGTRQLYLEPSQYLGGASGTDTLLVYGSNPALGPERASSRTVSLDITPPAVPRLKTTVTYFSIHYSDRLVQPISDFTASLTNPLYQRFVDLHPTPAVQQTLISESSSFNNFTGAPYDPASVAYILNDAYANATVQRIHGVDLTVRDGWHAFGGDLGVAANGAWLTLLQRIVSEAPEVRLSGTIFNPPDFKGRATATWQRAGWALTAALNYVSSEWDNSRKPAVRVASWSTVDAQVSYDFNALSIRWLRGLKASVSVQNLFNRNPPFVASSSTTYPGLGYDSTNASALGRFVSVYLAKSW